MLPTLAPVADEARDVPHRDLGAKMQHRRLCMTPARDSHGLD